MTELSGFVSFDPGSDFAADVARLNAAPIAPGLQPSRIWRSSNAAFSVAQKIVTPEDRSERQPHVDARGGVTLFDGYLFERGDLIRAHGFDPGLPDSALAAAWIERFGTESLGKLRGDYTLARWDPQERRLVLAVAPMGHRVLYYHAHGSDFYFASNLPLLFRFPRVPRELDPAQLALHLLTIVIDPAETLYRSIRILPTGTLLTIERGGSRATPLWRPDPTRRLRLRKDEDYIEAARELLERAVKARLRLVGTPAIMMSAGLDSSGVAATAACLTAPAPLKAYTAVPPPAASPPGRTNWYNSERDGMNAIAARHPNLAVEFCYSTGPAAVENDPTSIFLTTGRPHLATDLHGWIAPVYQAAQRDGHCVLLCGDAGNHTLSFDGLRGFVDLLRGGRLDLVARLLPAVATFLNKHPWDIVKTEMLIPLLPPRWRDTISRRRQDASPWARLGAMRPDFADEIGLDDRLWQAGLDGMARHEADSRAMLARYLQVRRSRGLENGALVKGLYGIERRDPLSDLDLVDFCLAIPREQYLLGGRTRSLARRVLADRLPEAITGNRSFGQPVPEWYDRLTPQRRTFAADLEALETVPLAAAILDLPRLKSLVADWPTDAGAAQARRFELSFVLPRAVHMGRFLRWADGGNR